MVMATTAQAIWKKIEKGFNDFQKLINNYLQNMQMKKTSDYD